MLVVDDCIISEDIIDTCFVCDITKCKGICCIEGDAGAPLEEEEISLLEDYYEDIKPFMISEGIEALELNGSIFDYDADGNFVTPLVDNSECAFLITEEGISKCAIEKAWEKGIIDFQKPVSCHLYPIRINKYNEFEALNYHAWDVCSDALRNGKQLGIPIYKFLKVPLVRKYGEAWYSKLCNTVEKQKEVEKSKSSYKI